MSLPNLWNHQKQAIQTSLDLPWYGLFFDPGCGKTRTAIETLRQKFNREKKIYRTIILVPPIVISNWKAEWHEYSKIDDNQVIPLTGSGEKRFKDFMKHASNKDGERRGCIFITNYEALLMPRLFQAIQAWEPECVILDEAHKVKNHEARRSELANKLCNPWDQKAKAPAKTTPKFKTILTGTPILKDPMDLFMQFKVMMGGFPNANYLMTRNQDDLIKNFYQFRGKYFEDFNARMKGTENYFPDFRIKPNAMEEINSILKLYSLRVAKNDCMDLPEEISQIIKVGMEKTQATHYASMKKDLIAYANDKLTATADMALVKALRLMQITSGFLPVRDETTPDSEDVLIAYESNPKDSALEELLLQLTPHSQVLVWAVWKHNYHSIKRVCEKLGLKYVEVNGTVTAKQKELNMAAFKSDPSIRVYIGHPGSGGIGVNLTNAPYDIFYSRTFSLEHYLQARARNHRGGQKQKVTHYDLVCENTIDELALEKLANKLDVSGRILDMVSELK